jgi:hypothetical protein
MYPPEYASLIDQANAGEPQSFFPAQSFLTDVLDTGMLNYFDSPTGRTNCTVGESIFSGQKQPGRFMWPSPYSPDEEDRKAPKYNAQWNLWACAFFPNITNEFRTSTLSPDNQTFLLESNVDTTAPTSTAVTSFLSTCLSSWCQESEDCATTSCSLDQLKIGDSMLSAASIDTCLDQLCYVRPRVSSNPDVAGIGVIASYFIQFTFVTTGLLCLLICVSALRWLPRSTSLQSNSDRKRASQPPRIIQLVKETILVALDDFQRAQCSFAIAINTASLITLQLSASTLSFVDRRAIVAASASGTLPTTLVLAALMAANKRHSTLTFCITFVTWIISLSVGLHPQIFRYKDTSSDYLTKYPAACGSSPPVNVCRTEPQVFQGAPTLFPIAICTMVALIGWKLHSANILPRLLPKAVKTRLAMVFGGGKFMLVPVVGITGVAYTYFIAFVTQIMREWDWTPEWSFGQIVAVSGWLPTLLMLLNNCIYGPGRGQTNQLPETLEVRRVEKMV